ncbi:DNA/RNA non-specific endonuclease [Streptomyces erythrochromogenes]|uniref:DNA/RNA non-specific endonuclease n=1 Tax=Streptomyces erythrochromogenes TaxID=285574 RepID=UPI0036954783
MTELVTTTPDHAGNVTVRLAGGKTIPIPAADKDRVMGRAAQQAKAQLKSAAAPRPCGTAYVTLKEKSNHHPVAIETGFVLPERATGYDWLVTIKGPSGYTREYTSRGNLALRKSWAGGDESDQDEAPGLYTAIVDPAASYVRLLSGDLCIASAKDTERLTVPQAACMDVSQPNSGDGWILNSTEPVPHRNRTDPTSPAGTRAAGAQACLRKKLGNGSAASGEPTGWLDAQLFRDTHSPGTAIARCHLIANILGGKGQTLDGGQDNLAPCWQVGLNTGTPSMRTYEQQIQKTLAALPEGSDDAVFYVVTPLYRDSDSTIPTGVAMSASLQRPDRTQTLLFVDTVLNTKGSTGLLNLGN